MLSKKLSGRVGGRFARIMAALGLVTGLFVVGAPAASAACLSIQETAASASAAPTATAEQAAAVTTPASSGVATNVVQPRILTWTPYDGFHITSYQKCLNRMNYLKGVRPDITHWNCEEFYQGACPSGSYYWMVMVGTNY